MKSSIFINTSGGATYAPLVCSEGYKPIACYSLEDNHAHVVESPHGHYVLVTSGKDPQIFASKADAIAAWRQVIGGEG